MLGSRSGSGCRCASRLGVLCLESLRALDHAVDLGLRQSPRVVFDLNLLLLARRDLLGGHAEHRVGVDVVGHHDLRSPAPHGRYAVEVELAEQVVVLGHGALALKDLDQHARLAVGVGGEGLLLLRRDTLVLRGMSVVMTPPAVSSPSESGVTSMSSRSSPSSPMVPSRIAACTVAPWATASSGLIPRQSSFPLKYARSISCTFGMRVEPPTSTTSSTADLATLASRRPRHGLHGLLEQEHVHLLKLGPGERRVEVDALKERVDLDERVVAPDSVRLARSHAVRSRRRRADPCWGPCGAGV